MTALSRIVDSIISNVQEADILGGNVKTNVVTGLNLTRMVVMKLATTKIVYSTPLIALTDQNAMILVVLSLIMVSVTTIATLQLVLMTA